MAAPCPRALLSGGLLLSACAPPPPAVLSPQGSTVHVGKEYPTSGATLLGRVDGQSGSGCAGFGTIGTYETAEADLRNRAAAIGANYVAVQTIVSPHDNGTQCSDNRMIVHGVAYALAPVAATRALPPQVPPQAAPSCDLTLRIVVHPDLSDAFGVEVTAENTSANPLDFDLDGRCPGGIVDLAGLGAGYDYYGTCAAGACPGPAGSKHVHLDVHGRATLASTTILGRGGSCTPALAPGRHSIQAVAPPLGVSVCSEAAVFDVPAAVPVPVVPPPAPVVPSPPLAPSVVPAPPAARSPAPSPPHGECASSADCVIDCPTPPGCCGWACGCKNAIPRARVASFEADYAKTCTRPPHCLAMGCAYEPAVMAACVNGRCAAASGLTAPATSPGH
jgi:Domain of unknown function (DUF4156)